MRTILKNLSVITVASLMLYGCGAPVDSAGDVSDIFTVSGDSLAGKVNGVCSTLDNSGNGPTLEASGVRISDCSDPGKYAINFQSADAFYFQGLDDLPDADGDVINIRIRSQAWLGKSIIGLASALAAKMKASEGTGKGTFDVGGEGGPSGIIDLDTEMIVAPEFDTEKLSFNMQIGIKGKGLVDVDNVIEAKGEMVDGVFAVSIYTMEDRTYKQSFLKSFQGSILIVPHASDVYVDVFLNIGIHKIGFVDGIIKSEAKKMLGCGMKDILKSVIGL